MKDIKKYIKWCKINHLNVKSGKVLDLYFKLHDLGFYDEIEAICNEYGYATTNINLISILKNKCPEIRA